METNWCPYLNDKALIVWLELLRERGLAKGNIELVDSMSVELLKRLKERASFTGEIRIIVE